MGAQCTASAAQLSLTLPPRCRLRLLILLVLLLGAARTTQRLLHFQPHHFRLAAHCQSVCSRNEEAPVLQIVMLAGPRGRGEKNPDGIRPPLPPVDGGTL